MNEKNLYNSFLKSLLLILIPLSGSSQTILPDNFKIGNMVEVFNRDSLKVYFDCSGDITDKFCAAYYRVGKMDSSLFNFSGTFFDYDINGSLYLKANMINNNIEGYAYYYYADGTVNEEGNYINNIREGKWVYYYPNGRVQKIYNFQAGEPLVIEAYNEDGKSTVVNGNGVFSTTYSKYKKCIYYEASGEILNGKLNGKWIYSEPKLAPYGTEIYESGKYIKTYGLRDEVFVGKPQVQLTMFYPTENLNMIENLGDCDKLKSKIFRYNQKDNIYDFFYPKLQKELKKYKLTPKNQWLIVGMKIIKYNKVEELNIASSINDTELENYIFNSISKRTYWKPVLADIEKKDYDIYFSIMVMDGQIIVLPDYVNKNKE